MTCPYLPVADAIASAISELPWPIDWVHQLPHPSNRSMIPFAVTFIELLLLLLLLLLVVVDDDDDDGSDVLVGLDMVMVR